MPASANARRDRSFRDSPLKRLLIRPGAIGDTIVSLPALAHLRTGYTEIWAPGRNLPLIGFADRRRSLASTGIDLVGITEPALAAFSEFDEIVSWYGANRPEFRAAVARLPFRFFPALPDGTCHAVDFFMRHAGGPDGAVPVIDCERRDEGFIAVHPFSGSTRKNWPLERFLAVAERLPLPVRFCVSPEQSMAGALQIEDLHELGCWLARARLYIGNDSGITHLAAAVGVPVIALFGPEHPSVWAPRGRASVQVIYRGAEVAAIEQEEVLEAVCAHPALEIFR